MARVYRFRSADRLLGSSRELDKQEIYFASPEELNDPTEGLRPIVWRGDSIVWTNFFRHYVYCLHWTCIRFALAAKDMRIQKIPIPVMGDVHHAMTPSMTNLNDLAFENTSKQANLSKLVDAMANWEGLIRDMNVLFFLQPFHLTAINGIRAAHRANGHDIPHLADELFPDTVARIPELLELATQIQYDNATDMVLELSSKMLEGLYFGGKYAINRRFRATQQHMLEDNLRFLYFDFPRVYLQDLAQLLYPNWYAACFSKNCKNAAVWASYGDDHKGICLVFKTTAESQTQGLTLNSLVRSGAAAEDQQARVHKFYDVDYGAETVDIDFFRSIGRLTIPNLLKTWYTDDTGNLSECASHLGPDEGAWRKQYWDRFVPGIVQKSGDWRHEAETRLVLYSPFDDLTPKERTVRYEFESLDEVIFGIRTPDSQKMDIIETIKNKCVERGRDRFRFSQAYYSRKTDSIESYELI